MLESGRERRTIQRDKGKERERERVAPAGGRALRKPKSHYRETKVRRLIIVIATADPSSSRRKREMEDARQRGYAAADEKKPDSRTRKEMRDPNVNAWWSSKVHAELSRAPFVPLPSPRRPLTIPFESNEERRDSTRFICVQRRSTRSRVHIYPDAARRKRVKFVIAFITEESCIFQPGRPCRPGLIDRSNCRVKFCGPSLARW